MASDGFDFIGTFTISHRHGFVSKWSVFRTSGAGGGANFDTVDSRTPPRRSDSSIVDTLEVEKRPHIYYANDFAINEMAFRGGCSPRGGDIVMRRLHVWVRVWIRVRVRVRVYEESDRFGGVRLSMESKFVVVVVVKINPCTQNKKKKGMLIYCRKISVMLSCSW